RHLVLEPLSGGTLRLRELLIRLLLFAGVAGGVRLDRAFLAAARDGEVPQLRRRQVRSAPGYPILLPGHRRRLRRRRPLLGGDDRGRQSSHLPRPRDGGRPAVGAYLAARPRYRRFPGRGLPHGTLAEAPG